MTHMQSALVNDPPATQGDRQTGRQPKTEPALLQRPESVRSQHAAWGSALAPRAVSVGRGGGRTTQSATLQTLRAGGALRARRARECRRVGSGREQPRGGARGAAAVLLHDRAHSRRHALPAHTTQHVTARSSMGGSGPMLAPKRAAQRGGALRRGAGRAKL